mmetsp:Transcript_93780/g.242796  ORF Transcript_93780/g.242796 Transcript_93780/m.242796 type:complete len:263 (-) Transcript_93780:12-800(-)
MQEVRRRWIPVHLAPGLQVVRAGPHPELLERSSERPPGLVTALFRQIESLMCGHLQTVDHVQQVQIHLIHPQRILQVSCQQLETVECSEGDQWHGDVFENTGLSVHTQGEEQSVREQEHAAVLQIRQRQRLRDESRQLLDVVCYLPHPAHEEIHHALRDAPRLVDRHDHQVHKQLRQQLRQRDDASLVGRYPRSTSSRRPARPAAVARRPEERLAEPGGLEAVAVDLRAEDGLRGVLCSDSAAARLHPPRRPGQAGRPRRRR